MLFEAIFASLRHRETQQNDLLHSSSLNMLLRLTLDAQIPIVLLILERLRLLLLLNNLTFPFFVYKEPL